MRFLKFLLIVMLVALVAGLWWVYRAGQLPPGAAEEVRTRPATAPSPPAVAGPEQAPPAVQEAVVVEQPPAQSGQEQAAAEPAAAVDEVVVLSAEAVSSLDPYRMIGVHPDGSVASHLWDTLTRLDDDLQVRPHLAESWRLVNNFTWEIKLREGVLFHNGEPLTAEAVSFSIDRAQSMPGSLETFAADVGLQEVKLVDDYRLQLVTRQPAANLPYYLSFLEILPPVYYSETEPARLARFPVGSGPYRLAGPGSSGSLVLEAVDGYWQGTPAIGRLVFETAPDPQVRLAALGEGRAGLVTDLPPLTSEAWNLDNARLEAVEGTERMLIAIRAAENSPLANKQVRQALNYAVNTQEIVDRLLNGYGARYRSWVNPPDAHPELEAWPYAPELARQLLAQAGYSQGFTTTVRTPVEVYYQDVAIAGAVAEQLRAIGLTVEVEPVNNWSIYAHELLTGDSPALFLLKLNSYGDGLQDLKNLSASFVFNPTRWQDPIFENRVEQASVTFSETSRTRLINEAQSIAYDEAPWIWLWRVYHFYGVDPDLAWTPRRDGLVYLYRPLETEGQANGQ